MRVEPNPQPNKPNSDSIGDRTEPECEIAEFAGLEFAGLENDGVEQERTYILHKMKWTQTNVYDT